MCPKFLFQLNKGNFILFLKNMARFKVCKFRLMAPNTCQRGADLLLLKIKSQQKMHWKKALMMEKISSQIHTKNQVSWHPSPTSNMLLTEWKCRRGSWGNKGTICLLSKFQMIGQKALFRVFLLSTVKFNQWKCLRTMESKLHLSASEICILVAQTNWGGTRMQQEHSLLLTIFNADMADFMWISKKVNWNFNKKWSTVVSRGKRSHFL